MVKNFSLEAEVFVICVYHRDPTGKDKYRNEYGKGREKERRHLYAEKLQIQTNRRDEMIDITHEAEAFLRKTGVKTVWRSYTVPIQPPALP